MNFQETLFLVNESGAYVTAVDIGDKGGVAKNWDGELYLWDMPKTSSERYEIISYWETDVVVAEDVHTMPMQGVVSSGRLMEQKGELRGICAAMQVELALISPLKWIECFTLHRTKHFKDKRKWKQHLLEIARELRPTQTGLNERTADAFLIWYYYARIIVDQPLKPKGTLIL